MIMPVIFVFLGRQLHFILRIRSLTVKVTKQKKRLTFKTLFNNLIINVKSAMVSWSTKRYR